MKIFDYIHHLHGEILVFETCTGETIIIAVPLNYMGTLQEMFRSYHDDGNENVIKHEDLVRKKGSARAL